jgi:hypothetical protein
LTTIDDADVCTTDVCNPDGTVNHDPAGQITVNLKAQALNAAVTRDVKFVITACDASVDSRVVPVSFDSFGQAAVVLSSVDATASWISVAEGHTLRRLEAVSIVSCSGAVDLSGARLLLTGDLHAGTVNQDNLCDITDFSILASRWNLAIDANLSEGADVTGNGIQNSADFAAMQANFFVVGEALDGCPAAIDGGDSNGGAISLEPVALTPMQIMPRYSIGVEQLNIPNAYAADMTGDGIVDVQDIREFAREYNLPLDPNFDRKLQSLEGKRGRGNVRR